MSGGRFNYKQYELDYIADEIEQAIRDNKKLDEWGYCADFPEEIIEQFKKSVYLIRQAAIHAQRIDWLLSGDDGEQSFFRRLEEDLKELEVAQQTKTYE